MNKLKINIGLVLLTVAALFISSCKVTQTYKRPPVAIDSLYRNAPTNDTSTIADIPWNKMFTDTLLQKLMAEGISNHYDLKVLLARIRQAAVNFKQSKAAFFPELSANTQFGLQELSSAQGRSQSASNQFYQLGVSSSWEADIWGKLRGAKRAALASLMASDAFKRTVQTQLIADIVTDYYN